MTLAKHLLGAAALAAILSLAAYAQEGEAPAEASAAEGEAEAAAAESEAPAAEGETVPETPAVEVTADTVIATVGGVEITMGHMIVMRARLPEQYQVLPDDVLFNGILDQMIQQIAISETSGVALSKGSALALENEERSLLAGEAMSDIADASATDEAVAALYAERFADAAPAQEYNAAHILVATEEEATAIKAELDGGADFAAIAAEKSTDTSGPGGGELGWFELGMMVEPFSNAVAALEAGQVSGPVQTDFGWHIVKLNEVRAKAVPTIDEVRGELIAELQNQAIDAAVAAAVEGAEVVRMTEGIDPAALRNIDLLEE
jgi:peptidyl-prolyl cis-trans isomerase C